MYGNYSRPKLQILRKKHKRYTNTASGKGAGGKGGGQERRVGGRRAGQDRADRLAGECRTHVRFRFHFRFRIRIQYQSDLSESIKNIQLP